MSGTRNTCDIKVCSPCACPVLSSVQLIPTTVPEPVVHELLQIPLCTSRICSLACEVYSPGFCYITTTFHDHPLASSLRHNHLLVQSLDDGRHTENEVQLAQAQSLVNGHSFRSITDDQSTKYIILLFFFNTFNIAYHTRYFT